MSVSYSITRSTAGWIHRCGTTDMRVHCKVIWIFHCAGVSVPNLCLVQGSTVIISFLKLCLFPFSWAPFSPPLHRITFLLAPNHSLKAPRSFCHPLLPLRTAFKYDLHLLPLPLYQLLLKPSPSTFQINYSTDMLS